MEPISNNLFEISYDPETEEAPEQHFTTKRKIESDDQQIEGLTSEKKIKSEEVINDDDTGEKVAVRMLLPVKHIGGLIGMKGFKIKELRVQSGCFINVLLESIPREAPDRVVVITGTLSKLQTCVKLFAELVLARENEFATKTNMNVSPGKKDSTVLQFLIPSNLVAIIIGKQGNEIKRLQATHNTVMKISPVCLPQSTEKVLTVQGSPNNIGSACIPVFKLYKQKSLVDFRPFVPGLSESNMPPGNQYGMPPGMSPMSNMPYPYFPQQMSPYSQSMPPSMPTAATTKVTSPLEVTLQIPHGAVGYIIGKGGSNIREMVMQTGATIRIDNNKDEKNMHEVLVKGSPEQRDAAIRLLNQKVLESDSQYGALNQMVAQAQTTSMSAPYNQMSQMAGYPYNMASSYMTPGVNPPASTTQPSQTAPNPSQTTTGTPSITNPNNPALSQYNYNPYAQQQAYNPYQYANYQIS